MTQTRLAAALFILALAACGGDDSGHETTKNPSADEDAGPEHGGEAGKAADTGKAAGSGGKSSSSSGDSAGKAGSAPPRDTNKAGEGGSSAAGSGGSKSSGTTGEGGKGGEGGRAEAGRAAPTGGRAAPTGGRGGPRAGNGGSGGVGQDKCPASAPEDGSNCEGIQGLSCDYGEMSCRCRHTEPVWLCEMPGMAAGRGGMPQAGAGGRGGRGNMGEAGRGRGGRGMN